METTILAADTRRLEGYGATIGFFDGVHRGHRYLLEQLRQQCAGRGVRSMAITFDRHPREVLCPRWQPQLLTTLTEKEALLATTGIDRLVVLPFSGQMASLSARTFMQQVLYDRLGVRLLLTGYDNHFGHRQDGHPEGFSDYQAYGQSMGMSVVAAQPLCCEGSAVSSSLVRRLLGEGRVAEAARHLGRPYTLGGSVVHGRQMGRGMGFPTANMQPEGCRLVPARGVYAVRVAVGGGEPCYTGMTNIGLRPTFGQGHQQTIETHIFDFSGDLYGQTITLSFVARLRGECHFASAHELARQLAVDARQAIGLLSPQQQTEIPTSL